MAGNSRTQTLHQVLNPKLFSVYQAGYALEESDFRLLTVTDDSKYTSFGLPYILDWQADANDFQVSSFIIDPDEYPLFYGAFEIQILPFFNGDCILMCNSFDCDITPPVAVIYLQKDGLIKWQNTFGENNDIYYADAIGLADANVIAIISESEGNLYYNFDGEIVTYGTTPEIYTQAQVTENSRYGYHDGKYARLNAAFQEEVSYTTDSVTLFQKLEGQKFLLSGADETVLLDSNFNVMGMNLSIKKLISAAYAGNLIYAVSPEGLYVLDTNLVEVKRYLTQPAEKMKIVFQARDSMMVVSQYEGINHDDLVSRKYKYAETDNIPYTNLVLESVDVPDTVLIDFAKDHYYEYQFYFDTITFRLYNGGEDTIRSFDLKIDWSSIIGFCSYYPDQWHIDTVHISPGAYYEFELVNYLTDTTGLYLHGPYCFWVELPNGVPDQNPMDDSACKSATLYSAIESPKAINDVLLFPNPVSDELHFRVDFTSTTDKRCKIYSVTGIQLAEFDMRDSNISYPVSAFAPGIYFLTISDKFGNLNSFKFIVAH